MSIKALPATSVRALGSGQALTDSLALVKELIENSLDASATQISIEVSQNVLDIIQVKDNGHGIPEEDRDAMALRYCTSKIRDFGDIQDCRSLGFRGEALASAAELAGALVITTRVEGEKVASACTIDRGGAIVGRKTVSTPVGTTVRVEGFFKHLPVRRENALRSATKSLSRLRALVQKYYLSHFQCRFSLRILPLPQKSGKGRSEDIIYAPSKTIQEAVQKAVGKEVTAACEWIDTSSSVYAEALAEDSTGNREENDEGAIILESFLPKPSADPAAISKKPQCTNFIFVDSRPVSCTRGTLKQIHSLYKSYLKSSISAPGISDPFIYLNIRCPPGSYDPNIEPAKDDVMFHDANSVTQVVEEVLKGFYGELKSEDKGSKGKGNEPTLNGFDLLLARKPKPSTPVNTPTTLSTATARKNGLPYFRPPANIDYDGVNEDEEELAAREMDVVMEGGFVALDSPQKKTLDLGPVRGVEEPRETSRLSDGIVPTTDMGSTSRSAAALVTPRRKSTNWGFNMASGAEDETNDDEPMEQHPSDNEETAYKDITISNPWTAAKMNAPIHSSSPAGSPVLPHQEKPFKPSSTLRQDNSSPPSPGNTRKTRGGRTSALITPSPSSPLVSSGMFTENRGLATRRARQVSNETSGNAWTMESWISRAKGVRDGEDGEDGEASPPVARNGFVSAANIYKGRLNEDEEGDDDENEHQRPSKQRTKRTKPVPKEAPKRRRLNNDQNSGLTAMNEDSNDSDLEVVPGPSKSSPHRNRFLAATAALSPPNPRLAERLPRGVLSLTDDPPHLPPPPVERTKSKRRRTKTLLPLDIVPDVVLQTHMLRKPVDIVTGGKLRHMFKGLRESDAYVGGSAAGFGESNEGEDEEKEDEGMFFCESREWDNVGVIGAIVKKWMLGIAEKHGEEGLIEGVVSMGWEWAEREDGEEEEERVLSAVGVEIP